MIPLVWRIGIAVALLAAVVAGLAALHHHIYQQGQNEVQARWDAANAAATLQAATTGTEAVTTYADHIQQDAPVVERVVTRIVRQCAERVPSGTGDIHAAGVRDGNAEDRAFAEAAGRDLQACASELERFRGLQEWKRRNGG